jgi:hypothetical protein
VNETKAQQGTGSVQRQAQTGPQTTGGGEASGRSGEKAILRTNIKAIREGHLTGGYCDTEKLHAAERALHPILTKELEAAKAKHGYSPDPKFKHPEIRVLELELNGLSWKPRLVVAPEGN